MAQTIPTQSIKLGNSNTQYVGAIGSYNTTVYKSDDDEQIIHWLSPLNSNTRHQGLRNERFDGVGNWLLETREFREWKGSEGGADAGFRMVHEGLD